MAKKNYEMTRADYENLNKKSMRFNIAIMAIAVASILTLFLTNFWKVKLKFEVNEATIKDVFGMVSEGETSDIFGKLDFSELDGSSIEASLSLEPDILLTSIMGGGGATTEKLMSSVVSDLSRQAANIMGEILKPLTKIVVSTVLDEVSSQITTELGDDFVDNIDSEGVENIINLIVAGTTDAELKVEIKNFIERMITEYGFSESEVDTLMEGEQGINSVVDEIVDGMAENLGATGEIGEKNISFDQVIVNLAGEALNFDTKNMSAEDRTKELPAFLVEQMPSGTISIIHYGTIGLAVLLLMSVVAWGLLFLFGFIRIFTKRKILYMGAARGFGILPYILLVIAPWIGYMILKIPSVLECLPESAGAVLEGLSLGFSSAGLLVSFIGACVLALLKWCGYGRIKKRIKYAVITDEFNQFASEYPGDSPKASFSEFSENDFEDFNSGNSDENFW